MDADYATLRWDFFLGFGWGVGGVGEWDLGFGIPDGVHDAELVGVWEITQHHTGRAFYSLRFLLLQRWMGG